MHSFMASVLHKALPQPYYPSNPDPSAPYDGLYDLPFVALNAKESDWYLTLDLQYQTKVVDIGPLLTLFLHELQHILGDGTQERLAKREWILQLFEAGNIDMVMPEVNVQENSGLLDSVVTASRSFLDYVAQERILRPVALRMALEFGFPTFDETTTRQIAREVIRRVIQCELEPF